MEKKKVLSEKVTALFNLKIGDISKALEEPARRFFGGDASLMDDDEITDASGEFKNLLVALLGSADPTDKDSPQFRALAMFFSSMAQRVLMRGGHVEDVVRYAQAMQHTLTQALEQDSGIESHRSRSTLLYFTASSTN